MTTPTSHAKVHEAVKAIFEEIKSSPYKSVFEFEGKLGKYREEDRKPVFEAGIPEETFAKLIQQFRASSNFETRVETSGDFAFKGDIRGTVTMPIQSGEFPEDFSFMMKKPIRHLDISCRAGISCHYSMRLSLKKEIPLPLVNGRDIGTYSSVRIKHRTSFIYKMWSFDFTCVWLGKDPVDAQTNPAGDGTPKKPDRFEVEIEYKPIAAVGADSAYLAVSMIEKLGDLLLTASEVTNKADAIYEILGDTRFDDGGNVISIE